MDFSRIAETEEGTIDVSSGLTIDGVRFRPLGPALLLVVDGDLPGFTFGAPAD